MTTKTRVHNCKRSRCEGDPSLILIQAGDRYYGPIGLYLNECSGHDVVVTDFDQILHADECRLCRTGWAILNAAFPVVRPPVDPNDLPFE